MKNKGFIKKIIGDDSSGLIKGVSFVHTIDNIKKIEEGSDIYESNTPLQNLTCYHKLSKSYDFEYRYVYFFDDNSQKLVEINLFLEYDSSKESGLSIKTFDSIIASLKEYLTQKYKTIKTEKDSSTTNTDYYTYLENNSTAIPIEVVIIESIDKESNIEKTLKIIWQQKL